MGGAFRGADALGSNPVGDQAIDPNSALPISAPRLRKVRRYVAAAPALLTRICGRTSRIKRVTWSGTVTSTVAGQQRPSGAMTAVSLAPGSSMSHTATSAPARAKANAIDRPVPIAAP